MLHEFLSALTDDLFYMTGAEDESDIKYKDIVTVTNNKFESVGFDIRDDWCKISIHDISLLLYRIITKDMRIPLTYVDRGTLTDPRKFVDHVSTLCCSIYDHWFRLPLDRQDINLLKKYLQPEESTVRLSWWGYPDKDIASFYVGGLGIDYELNLDKDTLHELSNNIINKSNVDRKGVLTLDLNEPIFIMSIWYRSFILSVSLRDFAKDILREASHQFTGAKISSVNIKPYGFNPEGATQKIIEDNYTIKMGSSSYKISEFIDALSAEFIKIITARKSAVPPKQRELILNKINSLLVEDLHESSANKKPMNLYRVYYMQKSDDTSTYKDVPAYSSLQAANYVKKKVWNVYQVTDVQLLETGKLKEGYPEPRKLYSIKDGEATWDNDAQDFIWWDSESKNEPKYASSYKCKMSPKDFLDLTTDRGADALMKGDTFGLGGRFRVLDVDEFNKEKRQPIFLIISFEESLIRTSPDFYRGHFEADVVGHEGRHRMYALMKAGVKEVDVQLKVADTMYFDRMKPYKISKLDLIGQFNDRVKVTVNNPIAMSWDSHKELNPNVEKSLIEDIEKHEELNPKLWDESGNLKPEVREKILEIAKEFTDGLKEDGIKFDLKDIRLVGSNCSYNYTDKSDLDVHLIMDTDSLECPDDLYPLLYSAYRSLFNGKLDIDFYGIPVELYVETE